jgi:hypothetical protein
MWDGGKARGQIRVAAEAHVLGLFEMEEAANAGGKKRTRCRRVLSWTTSGRVFGPLCGWLGYVFAKGG